VLPVDTLPADDTRTRVLDVAMELISEKGYAATSTREVCERIGFTKAALYYHFKAKDELLAALVQPLLDAMAELTATAEVSDAPAARREVVRRYAELVCVHVDLMRVMYDDPSVRAQPVLAGVRPFYARLHRLLAGTESPDSAELARARAATGAVHGALVRADPGEDREVLRGIAVTAACNVLGLRPATRGTA
jgi:AcrR family transcriptional regulator